MASGSPSSVPTLRTSSLNSARSGSTSANCRSSGSPPTLWWLLIVDAPVPPPDLDDVGVERALDEELHRLVGVGHDHPRLLLEDPDELAADRLALGLRVGDAGQRVEEALARVGDPQLHAGRGDEVLLDLLGLALAQQPVVDEHAGELVADGPLDERSGHGRVDAAGQAPTRLSPTCSRIRATESSTTFGVVQVGRQPAPSSRNRLSTSWPCSLCSTSGWNSTPYSPRSTSSKDATGVAPVDEVTVNPGGASATASPCDIQTNCCSGSPLNSTPGSTTASAVRPYSAVPVRATAPPRDAAMAWNPSPMPKVGTPVSKKPATWGAPSAYTLDGPPDRMTAFGTRARISSAVIVCGTISLRRGQRAPGAR